MSAALTLSILFHAFLLSLQFGIRGLGLPGLHMPWEERRAQAPGITVRISNVLPKDSPGTTTTPEQLPTEAVASAAPDMPAPPPAKAFAEAAPAALPQPSSGMRVVQQTEPPAVTARSTERKVVPATSRRRAQRPARRVRHSTSSLKPRPPIAVKKPVQQEAFVLPHPHDAEASKQQPVVDANIAEAPNAAVTTIEDQPMQPQDTLEAVQMLREKEDARRAEETAAKKLEEERRLMEVEAQRQAAEMETRRQAEEAARQSAQRLEEEEQLRARQLQAKKLEEENATRQAMEEEAHKRAMQQLAEENARRAQLAEAQRQEAARAQRLAEKQEAQRRAEEAARQQDLALAEQQRHGATGGQAPSQGVSAGQGGESLAARQTEHTPAPTQRPARVVPIEEKSSPANATNDGPIELSDEQMASMQTEQVRKVEVTRLEPQTTSKMADAAQDTRRRTIFGGAEDDIVLKMYIADWIQAIERNVKLGDETSSKDKLYGDSLVTVALRSDGRVESITIHRSNGRAGLDKAVRRIVQAEVRYKAFPPDLMRRYDVIEIRRVWKFEDVLRILEDSR